jgi:hypothetical protein
MDVIKKDYEFLKKAGLCYGQMANLSYLIFEKYIFGSHKFEKKISFIYDLFSNLKPLIYVNKNNFNLKKIKF